jgi:two-component system response regulator PilR (NtrC family)
MAKLPVLIVDDETDICDLVAMTLARKNIDSDSAHNIAAAKQLLEKKQYALCLTDMRLPDGNGLELIQHMQSATPSIPVAMITAHGNMDTAISALKYGAFDFLTKPIDLDQLKTLIDAALQLEPAQKPSDTSELNIKLAGQSTAAQALRELILRVARSQAPVFIQGESGTGKEVAARQIHEHSARKSQPFVAVNCGAIPAELVESEFFGHKKGSFTGATEDKIGLFQSADGGTLLLDEVADLPLAMQVKLLRAIQEKAVRPVGHNKEIAIDVRILSATHKNLAALVKDGLFRSDLFYRINVIELNMPALRDRSEDIHDIAQQILARLAQRQQTAVAGISDAAIECLASHSFPGNIRELENTLERSLALGNPEYIDVDDLQLQTTIERKPNATETTQFPSIDTSASPSVTLERPTTLSLDEHLQSIEKQEINAAMERCRWNKTEAAKYLGISFRSLRYRMKKLGLEE